MFGWWVGEAFFHYHPFDPLFERSSRSKFITNLYKFFALLILLLDRSADRCSLYIKRVLRGYNSGTNMLRQFGDFGRY
jgi:hypothetical protein